MSTHEGTAIRNGTMLSYTSVAAFFVVSLFAGLLFQIGSPLRFVAIFMLTFVVGIYIFLGIFARTMNMDVFQTGNRSATQAHGAQALASGVIGSGIYIFLAGQFYETGLGAFSLYWGWLMGLALAVILFAAFVGRSDKVTLPALLGPGQGLDLLQSSALVVSIICSFLLLLFQLESATLLGQKFFFLPEKAIVTAICLSVGFCVLAGGIQGVHLARQIAFPLMTICFFAPLIWISVNTSGIPVPQLAFGLGASAPIGEFNTGLAQSEALFGPGQESGGTPYLTYLATVMCVGCGIAATPHLLQHFPTLRNGKEARRSGYACFWMLLAFLSAVPTFAVFVKLDLYTSLLGVRVGDLSQQAAWLFSLSGAGPVDLISICGIPVVSIQEVISACGAGEAHILSWGDITINADLVPLASPALHQLPPLITAIFAAGALLALCSTMDGIVLNLGLSVSNDGYRQVLKPKSPKSVRLFMTRVFISLFVACSGYITVTRELDHRLLFESSLALTAASLFPALVAIIWFSCITRFQVLVALLSGFFVTSALLFFTNLGLDLQPYSGDEIMQAWLLNNDRPSNFISGLLGMLAAFGSLLAGRIFKRVSKPKQREETNHVIA